MKAHKLILHLIITILDKQAAVTYIRTINWGLIIRICILFSKSSSQHSIVSLSKDLIKTIILHKIFKAITKIFIIMFPHNYRNLINNHHNYHQFNPQTLSLLLILLSNSLIFIIKTRTNWLTLNMFKMERKINIIFQ